MYACVLIWNITDVQIIYLDIHMRVTTTSWREKKRTGWFSGKSVAMGRFYAGTCRCFMYGRNRVINIMYFDFEMVLWTIKYIIIYTDLDPSLEVIALRPAVWYWRWTCVTKRWVESLKSSCGERKNGSRAPYLKGRRSFIGWATTW
jgi:hypothetical protein